MVRSRILESRLQRRIADQQGRLSLFAERHVLGFGQEHLRQHDRGSALRGDGDRAYVLQRRPGDELDRVDRPLGADAEPRQNSQPVGVACVLDRRDRCQVALARKQRAVQVRRDADELLDLGVEPIEDRCHVHVADSAEADHVRLSTTA